MTGALAWARGRLARPRLTDAVVVAAAALLGMKLAGFLAGPAAPADGELSAFARVLAHARTNYVPPDPATTGSVQNGAAASPPAAPGAQATPAAAPGQRVAGPEPAASPSERALLERLGERREELQQRGRDLDTRTKLLENAEKRLEGRLQELRSLEERTDPATRRNEGEAAQLKNLVIMYEAMKPKEAARVFERLPQDVLVPVVSGMNPRKMAEVLAAMNPEAAERLTVALANRARTPAPGPGGTPSASLPPGELPAIEPPAPRR